MSFGRWLLVHSFSVFLVSLFIFGYIYRAELQLENAYQQLLNIAPSAVESSPSKTTQSEVKPGKDTATENIKVTEKNTDIVENIDKADVTTEAPALISIPTVPTTQTSVLDSQPELLLLARQAYWDKSYADAIYFYRQLIQENRNNPDYYGELGNIYYSLNDNMNASGLYYQAAQVFIQHNQPERARTLLAPITAMNRELGDRLKFQLR